MLTLRRSLFCLVCFHTLSVGASTHQWSISDLPSSQGIEVTSGVWNVAEGVFHPSLEVGSWVLSGYGGGTTAISIGDGRHGDFNLSRVDYFGRLDGNTILIDTSVFRELSVTSFELPDGYTLRPLGPYPLVIRSLSTIVINGVVDCSGENGSNANPNSDVVASGGIGHCGGGDGGAGAYSNQPAQDGLLGWNSVSGVGVGGAGGNSATVLDGAGGGGGGGAFPINGANLATAGNNGVNSGMSAGALGNSIPNDPMAIEGGGAGGGGGGCTWDGVACQGGHSGAGGGGGGGIIYMFSKGDILVGDNGQVIARGGLGGQGNGTGLNDHGSGSGGNGGGGSIWMASGGTFTICSFVNGTICLTGGAVISAAAQGSGVAVALGGGGSGGGGAGGRVWVTDNSGSTTGIPNVNSELLFSDYGRVRFQTSDSLFSTGSIDLLNTRPTLNSISYNAQLEGASSLVLELAGSDDNFVLTDSGWVDSANLSLVKGYRYIKLRATLRNDSPATPSYLTSITLDYSGEPADYYDFNGACGTILGGWGEALELLLILFLIWQWLRVESYKKLLSQFVQRRREETLL